jgi:hypothetical protein
VEIDLPPGNSKPLSARSHQAEANSLRGFRTVPDPIRLVIQLRKILPPLLLVFVGGLLETGFGGLAGQEPEKPERLSATNAIALNNHVGRKVIVYGLIESTGKSSSGHHFLNFTGKQLTAFCPQEVVARFKEGAPADLYKNKEVEITGELSLFNGKLQIRLAAPGDIRERDPPGKAAAKRATVELKEVSREVWVSPAGLRYQGRDPEGLTRVEHVLRHAQDIPDRDGSHGVFDGDRGVVFALIDEAWQLAQTKKLGPQSEGNRSSYLVAMNRRVGYLGGRVGRERGNPPLTRVFIVFETGSTNIITAFPR